MLIQNNNFENPSQKLILLSDNMFDYIVRLLVWAVEGGAKVSLHPVVEHYLLLQCANLNSMRLSSPTKKHIFRKVVTFW